MDLVWVYGEQKAVDAVNADRAVMCSKRRHVPCSSLRDADEDHFLVGVVFGNLSVYLRGRDVGVQLKTDGTFGHVGGDSACCS